MHRSPRDLYDLDDLTWLERPDREVETPWVERKSKFDKDELARQISGFANGDSPGGLVVVGVSKEGRLVGLGEQRAKAYEEVSRIPVESASFEHRFVRLPDGIEILLLLVQPSEKRVVCRADGRAFVRRGTNTVELSADQLREIRYQRGERSYEEEPIARFDLGLLEPDTVAAWQSGIQERNGTTLPRELGEELVDKHLATRRDGQLHLTVAGAIALARKPTDFVAGARIHFIRVGGVDERYGAERNVTKERWFEGSTVRMLAETREFVRTLVKEFDYLGKSGTFVTEPEYPELVWDEALVNAILHRSYSIGNSPIHVRMFDDRLEVESPGGFPGMGRPNQEGDFPGSNPRNPRLGDALRYLGLVRLAKEGTRRMKQEMEKMGLSRPSFDEIQGQVVLVTLRNDIHRRGSAASAKESWQEVARLIGEELAIYRRRGYEKWSRLRTQEARAPWEVIDAADRLLCSEEEELAPEEKQQIVRVLAQEKSGQIGELAKRWAGTLQIASFVDPSDYSAIAGIIARSDEALENVLANLEHRKVRDRPLHRKLAFEALASRLRQEPLPPRDWTNRVVKVCRQYPTEGAHLYWQITDQTLDRS